MDNVIKFKKPFQFRIGGIIFFALMIYLIALIVTFFTQTKLATYEVTQGDLASYYSYKALAIRKEKVIKASNSGYITYFANEDTKVSSKSVVYALSSTNNIFEEIKTATTEDESFLTEGKKEDLLNIMDEFSYAYSDSSFYESYSFRDDLNIKIIEDLAKKTKKKKMQKGMSAYYAYQAGIVLYETDGMEQLTKESFSADDIRGVNYVKDVLKDREQVNAGDNVYKIITDENWYLVAIIDDKLLKDLEGQSYVDLRIDTDNHLFEVPFEIRKENGNTFIVLSMNSGVIRYAKQRYLDIDIIVNNTKGFKVPKSSIDEVAFLAVPKDYLTASGNSKGFMKLERNKSGKEETVFVSTSLYSSDDKYYYVHDERLKAGDEILLPESTERTKLTTTKVFPCVYCVNKGYAVLRIISPQGSNEDYTIVDMNTNYGLKNYDHIVLDAKGIKEGDMIN